MNVNMRVAFTLEGIKPISINAAYQGRRFKTPNCLSYEQELAYALPKMPMIEGDVIVSIHFYLVNYATTDVSNLVKILEDMLVKRGLIEDDRKVVELHLKKTKAKKHKIKISISKA
ncbi:hypothetical protein LCGC14_1578590 [marine sediment metagenome]|uniref:Uncharacterized protein n=1 Tax=marine sediment metagenome TaxID=412755 RepID=A0A0F9LHV6_9ZZZZ